MASGTGRVTPEDAVGQIKISKETMDSGTMSPPTNTTETVVPLLDSGLRRNDAKPTIRLSGWVG
jgi:hypothetical protein